MADSDSDDFVNTIARRRLKKSLAKSTRDQRVSSSRNKRLRIVSSESDSSDAARSWKKRKDSTKTALSEPTSRNSEEGHFKADSFQTPEKKKTSEKEKNASQSEESLGFCPCCQMPFRGLVGQSPRWHVMDCLETKRTPEGQCPQGVHCTSSSLSHFKRFSHQDLAMLRTQEQDASDGTGSPKTVTTAEDSSTLTCTKQLNFNQTSPCMDSGIQTEVSVGRTVNETHTVSQRDLTLGSIAGQCQYRLIDEAAVSGKDEALGMDVETGDRNYGMDDGHEGAYESDEDIFAPSNIDAENLFFSPRRNDCLLSQRKSKADGEELIGSRKAELQQNGFHDNEDDFISSLGKLASPKSVAEKCSNSLSSPSKKVNNSYAASPKASPAKDKTRTSGSQGAENAQRQTSLLSFFKTNDKPAASQKNLKQKDLGVYFGLKPLQKATTGTASDTQTSKQKVAGRKNGRGWYTQQKDSSDSASEGSQQRNRSCPFYKKIPGTNFVVDAFRYGVIPGITAYFLSHFHYDHYGGLAKKFAQKLYCSKVTANLVKLKIRVDAKYVIPLELNQEIKIEDTTVVLLDANHCPGAVMFLFTLPNGRNLLHTGDFRASVAMEAYPFLKGVKIHQLYLDTTYCNPDYSFPSQHETVEFAVSVATSAVRRNPKTLIVCGTYTIGKEKVFLGIADALGCKVCVKTDKKRILDCLECDTVKNLLTTDPKTTRLHIIPMGHLTLKALGEYLASYKNQYNEILAFEPTGWTHSDGNATLTDIKPTKRGNITKYGVPYSEHSSFSEMGRFVKFTKPDKIIPTVNNGSAASRKAMQDIFNQWQTQPLQLSPRKRS